MRRIPKVEQHDLLPNMAMKKTQLYFFFYYSFIFFFIIIIFILSTISLLVK